LSQRSSPRLPNSHCRSFKLTKVPRFPSPPPPTNNAPLQLRLGLPGLVPRGTRLRLRLSRRRAHALLHAYGPAPGPGFHQDDLVDALYRLLHHDGRGHGQDDIHTADHVHADHQAHPHRLRTDVRLGGYAHVDIHHHQHHGQRQRQRRDGAGLDRQLHVHRARHARLHARAVIPAGLDVRRVGRRQPGGEARRVVRQQTEIAIVPTEGQQRLQEPQVPAGCDVSEVATPGRQVLGWPGYRHRGRQGIPHGDRGEDAHRGRRDHRRPVGVPHGNHHRDDRLGQDVRVR